MNIRRIVLSRPEISIAAGALVISAFVAFMFYQSGDSPAQYKRSAEHLRMIYRALLNFQSEAYFGKPPKDLQQLASYKAVYYITSTDKAGKPKNSFSRIERNYSLIVDPRILFKPSNMDKVPGEDQPDYSLLPWYQNFLSDNTIIAWDNPGNFQKGGNVLLANGEVRMCSMATDEYELFIRSLKTMSGRDFVREKCPGVSVRGFQKEFSDDVVTSAITLQNEPVATPPVVEPAAATGSETEK